MLKLLSLKKNYWSFKSGVSRIHPTGWIWPLEPHHPSPGAAPGSWVDINVLHCVCQTGSTHRTWDVSCMWSLPWLVQDMWYMQCLLWDLLCIQHLCWASLGPCILDPAPAPAGLAHSGWCTLWLQDCAAYGACFSHSRVDAFTGTSLAEADTACRTVLDWLDGVPWVLDLACRWKAHGPDLACGASPVPFVLPLDQYHPTYPVCGAKWFWHPWFKSSGNSW